jgi:hypothetical protein
MITVVLRGRVACRKEEESFELAKISRVSHLNSYLQTGLTYNPNEKLLFLPWFSGSHLPEAGCGPKKRDADARTDKNKVVMDFVWKV